LFNHATKLSSFLTYHPAAIGACEIHIGFLFNHATKLNSFLTYHPAAIGNGAELSDEKIDDHAWLAEVETPDLYMRQGAYTGPTVKV